MDRDGQKACDLLTKRGRSILDDADSDSSFHACVVSVENQSEDELDVQVISVEMSREDHGRAVVKVVLEEPGDMVERQSLRLVRRHGSWRIDGPAVVRPA